MKPHQKVEDIKKSYERDYTNILQLARRASERARDLLGQGFVDKIYDRSEAPASNSVFKDSKKIAIKLRNNGLSVTANNFLKINDVVGLSIIVKYSDYVDHIARQLRVELSRVKLEIVEDDSHQSSDGYYAHHIVCEKVGSPNPVRCEVQIRSTLHNAWASKMHDLTYKPSGTLDPRLSAMMTSIADTIENLEKQSCMIRDMILSNWNVEEAKRIEARSAVFEGMLNYSKIYDEEMMPEEAKALYNRIEEIIDSIGSMGVDDAELVSIREDIEQICLNDEMIRYGWLFAARIVAARSGSQLWNFFARQAEQWLEVAARAGEEFLDDCHEIRAVPLVYYSIGDLDGAIEIIDAILANARFASLEKLNPEFLIFNKVTFEVEREYHTPTTNAVARQKTKRRLETALAEIETNDEELLSCIADTRGMLKIAFAETKSDVHLGIEECISARQIDTPEKKVADAYCDLNMRLGWRRFFELEMTDKTEPDPG